MDRVLLCTLVGSLALNVWLGTDAYHRRAQRLEQERRAIGVTIGAIMPPLEVEQLGNGKQTIAFDSSLPTVLYVHVSTCGWCRRNWENTKALMAKKDRYQFVLLSLDTEHSTMDRYIQEIGLEGPHYYRPTESTSEAYNLGTTPMTMVIEPGGRLSRAWPGAYSSKYKTDIETFFDVTLPGLAEVAR